MPIRAREEAPESLRAAVIQKAQFSSLNDKRRLICEALSQLPDRSVYSDRALKEHIDVLVQDAPWYHVYDIAERFYARLNHDRISAQSIASAEASDYQRAVNHVLITEGLGWKMVDGKFEYRGEDGFEQAVALSSQANLPPTTNSEIAAALKSLSERPTADYTGAIQHSMAGLECLLRELTGERKRTLGDLLGNKYQDRMTELGIETSLSAALSKLWGFASQKGRHLNESKEPTPADAELVTMLAVTVATYLSKRNLKKRTDTPSLFSNEDIPF